MKKSEVTTLLLPASHKLHASIFYKNCCELLTTIADTHAILSHAQLFFLAKQIHMFLQNDSSYHPEEKIFFSNLQTAWEADVGATIKKVYLALYTLDLINLLSAKNFNTIIKHNKPFEAALALLQATRCGELYIHPKEADLISQHINPHEANTALRWLHQFKTPQIIEKLKTVEHPLEEAKKIRKQAEDKQKEKLNESLKELPTVRPTCSIR